MADSTAPLQTVTLPAKRKRAQVSYLDEDDELDGLLGVDNDRNQDAEDESGDDDVTYGSRKRVKKASSRKKAKTSCGSKAAKDQKPFSFMLLPPELRDQIYELALIDPNGISLVSKTKSYRRTVTRAAIPENDSRWYYGRRRRQPYSQSSQSTQTETAHNPLTPALLAVSKQIRSETLGYLYQQPIALEDTHALHSFLALIGSNRSMVTDLTVKGWGTGRGTHHAMNFCAFPLLGLCTHLRTLFLDCSIGWHRNPQGLARQIFRDSHHFFEAYGAANGKKDAAVDLLELSDANYDLTRHGCARNVTLLEKDDFKEQFQAELRKLLGC
ncbi:hypothetical protein LTR36_006729 [Oleoguttula mirabilis]|uniref:2EXR domain-containing protein n=1 Tax=Oleoguttula mirabilis TaxID=1507867 RepID=A0AAV9JC29_9PEZI|nr:hypothetical protein LTR36_006729 [Oleoguttula mirabilis]